MDIAAKYKDRVIRINGYLKDSLKVIEDPVLRDAMAHYPSAGGKRLRPLLAMVMCEAVGGRPDSAMPFGVGLEMVHNFTLVHDDVMDEDDMRRGIQTVHAKYGVPEAILAGDAMFARAFELALETDIDGDRTVQLVDTMARSVRLLAEGQQLDMSFEKKGSVSHDEYMRMIELKTAVLFSAAARGGAVVGGASENVQEEMFEYGRLIGLAFQIRDDVLDLISTKKSFGKPVLNDIRNGKKTLIAIRALEELKGKDREEFVRVLGKKDASEAELIGAKNLMEKVGAIDHASRVAAELVAKGKERLHVLKDSQYKDALKEFADYMITRES